MADVLTKVKNASPWWTSARSVKLPSVWPEVNLDLARAIASRVPSGRPGVFDHDALRATIVRYPEGFLQDRILLRGADSPVLLPVLLPRPPEKSLVFWKFFAWCQERSKNWSTKLASGAG